MLSESKSSGNLRNWELHKTKFYAPLPTPNYFTRQSKDSMTTSIVYMYNFSGPMLTQRLYQASIQCYSNGKDPRNRLLKDPKFTADFNHRKDKLHP